MIVLYLHMRAKGQQEKMEKKLVKVGMAVVVAIMERLILIFMLEPNHEESESYKIEGCVGEQGEHGAPGRGGKGGYGGKTYFGVYMESKICPNLREVVANLTPNDKNEALPRNESSHDVNQPLKEDSLDDIIAEEEEEKISEGEELKAVGKDTVQGTVQDTVAQNAAGFYGANTIGRVAAGAGVRAANVTSAGGALLSVGGFLKSMGVGLLVQGGVSILHAAIRNGWITDEVEEKEEENGNDGLVPIEKNTSGLVVPVLPENTFIVEDVHKGFLDFFTDCEEHKAKIIDIFL